MEKLKLHFRKYRVRYIVAAALLLAAYIPFIATRYSGHTTYIPFTGRVFSISSDEITSVRFQSGNTFSYIDYYDENEIKEAVDFLNSFHYFVWLPSPPLGAGWSYRVVLNFDNGEWVSYFFYDFTILVNGVWYFGMPNYFSDLTETLDALPPDDEPSVTIPASSTDIPNMTEPPATSTDIG